MSVNINHFQDAFDYQISGVKNASVQENDYIRLLLQAPFNPDRLNLILFIHQQPASFCESKYQDFIQFLPQQDYLKWQEVIEYALEKGIRFKESLGQFSLTGQSIGRGYIVIIANNQELQQENEALKASLKSLSERAEKYKEYCDLIQEPFWIRDTNLNLIFANQIFLEMLDCKNIEDVTKNNLWICNSAKADILARLAIQKNDIQSMDITYVKEGRTLWGSVTETPVTNDEGQFFLFGQLSDKTKEKELEQRASHLEAGIQEILTNISIAASLFDSQRRLRFYNQAFMNLWGLDAAYLDTAPDHLDILDKLRANRLLPEQRDYKSWRDEIFAPYHNLNGCYEAIWQTPQQKTIKCTVSSYANGGVVCLQEDVTDYLALEHSHSVLTDNLRNTLNALDEGVLLCDMNGKIKVFNSEMSKIFDTEINLNTHLTTLLKKMTEDNPLVTFIHKICHFIQSGFPDDNKYAQECMIDSTIFLAAMIRLSTGDLLIHIRDETAILNYQKMLQFKSETLKENEHIRESFFRRISHNLRDPMTAIAGFAEMLQTEIFGSLNDKQSEYISDMRNSVNDLLQITDNLAELVRLDTHTSDNFDVVPLHTTLLEAIHAMQNEANYRNITIEQDINQEYMIHADAALLRQSFIQILENAIFYSPRGSKVQVILEKIQDQIAIKIIDQGAGIEQDIAKALQNQEINNIKGYGLRYVTRVCMLHKAYCQASTILDSNNTIQGTCVTLSFDLNNINDLQNTT